MHGQSIFGLSSLHSLYSLISKRCYISDGSVKKTCLIFQAKMISLQLEWHIPLHAMVLVSFLGQKCIDSWDLTSEAVLRSSEATFQSVLKWFKLHSYTALLSKWPRNGLHELSTSLISEADMEAAEAWLSKWLDFKAHAQISPLELFINLRTSNLRLHGFK